MRENRLKKLWETGQPALGGWLGIPSSVSAEMMAHAGFDWLCVDMQHGTIDYQVGVTMLQAISTTDSVPIVRVPWNEPGIIMKALDAGAYGVIIPMVNSRAEAEAAVVACRYPGRARPGAPDGIRSYGPARAVLYAGTDYFPNANETVLCIPMIETREALGNLDEIVSTPGVDAVFIGPSDLSVSLGLPPGYDQDDATFTEAVESVAAVCKKHGVVAGVFCGTPAVAKRRIEQGFRLLQVADDGRTMVMGAAAALAELRADG